jgi:two-component system sensor histidine kinase KdpD
MQFFIRSFIPFLLRITAVGLVVGAVTLLLTPLRDFLGVQVIALIYLLPVILSTFRWGLTSGILAGLMSFLAFNYFFLPPYHTLAVHQTQDLITLGVFLFVAVIISQLIGQAQAGKPPRCTTLFLLLPGCKIRPPLARC